MKVLTFLPSVSPKIYIFAAEMEHQQPINTNWSENIIIADANYVDNVAFDLIVNFERIIERRIPPADLAQWVECVAMDGGMRPNEEQQTHVVLVYDKEKPTMENFNPSDLVGQIDAQAFKGPLGEFSFSAINAERLASKEDLLTDTLRLVASQEGVKRVMIIPDEQHLDNVREALRKIDDDAKRITVFAMQPFAGGNFRQEILGYSLMQALGIRSDEIK